MCDKLKNAHLFADSYHRSHWKTRSRKKDGILAKVIRIEYDPNRSCFIALIKYEDGELSYVIAPQKLKVQSTIVSGKNADIKVGNCLSLQDIPVGINIHNVELQPGAGGKIARSAGTSVSISGVDGNYKIREFQITL